MWPCVEKQPSHIVLIYHSELPTMLSMETVNLILQLDPVPTLYNRPILGGKWTCWNPTLLPLLPSQTEETAVQKGSTGQRSTSATLYKTTVLQTQCKWTKQLVKTTFSLEIVQNMFKSCKPPRSWCISSYDLWTKIATLMCGIYCANKIK